MICRGLLYVAVISAATAIHSALAAPKHGIAMHGEPALAADFQHLPYANPNAPKGGVLKLATTGSFDSTNPFIVKGQAVTGVRTYVFESLLGRNWDEPFSLYGLLAESIDVSDDFTAFSFRLRPQARFSDGTPVTAQDVAFSLKLLLIIGLMPVVPQHQWEGKDFERTTLSPLIGSGPYLMESIRAGESISYRHQRNYWGKDLPLSRGQWNFDEIRIDYYRDNNSTFEAFKKGLADIRIEPDPTRWSNGYDFPAVKSGAVILERHEQRSPAPLSAFAMNTRRKLFADRRVRDAIIHAFDFEWANRNLFHGLFRRTSGYYAGSELSSAGVAASPKELSLLGHAKAV